MGKAFGRADAFSRFFLEEGQRLQTFASDIRDFYHVFQVSRDRAMRNTFQPELSASDVRAIGADPSSLLAGGCSRFVAAMSTQCMGDQSGVEFAQGAHMALAARAGALVEDDLLSYSMPPIRGPVAAGIVIDDYVCMEVVPVTSARPSLDGPPLTEGARRTKKLLLAYSGAGLASHPSKLEFGVDVTTKWGAEVHGVKGEV